MLVAIGFLSLATVTQSFIVSDNVACFEDKFFDATEQLNKFFTYNVAAKNAFMIVCGLMMDIMVLTQFYRFAFFGTTWRLIIALMTFYICRFLCQ